MIVYRIADARHVRDAGLQGAGYGGREVRDGTLTSRPTEGTFR
jgi:hypothetical protein